MHFILPESVRTTAWEAECWTSRLALTSSLNCVIVSFGVSLNYSVKQLKKTGHSSPLNNSILNLSRGSAKESVNLCCFS